MLKQILQEPCIKQLKATQVSAADNMHVGEPLARCSLGYISSPEIKGKSMATAAIHKLNSKVLR